MDSSCVQSRIPHITKRICLSRYCQVLLRANLSLLRLKRKNASVAILFRRNNHSVCIAKRIRPYLMTHAPNHTHDVSCVKSNDNVCADLQWHTRVSSTFPYLASFFRVVFSRAVSIVKVMSLFATNATTDHKCLWKIDLKKKNDISLFVWK